MKPLNTAIGTQDLCAWQPVAGVTWVQTRLPDHARRLAKRHDSRLVVRGMAGGYLKTFEFRHSLLWAQRLMRRYDRKNQAANARLKGAERPAGAFSSAGSVKTAELTP